MQLQSILKDNRKFHMFLLFLFKHVSHKIKKADKCINILTITCIIKPLFLSSNFWNIAYNRSLLQSFWQNIFKLNTRKGLSKFLKNVVSTKDFPFHPLWTFGNIFALQHLLSRDFCISNFRNTNNSRNAL